MVTILDVAAHAGVSKSTVSLVINRSPLVKDETRLKVEQSIEELGYVINNNARCLIKNENNCLGIIIAIEDHKNNSYEYNNETGLYSYNITNGIPTGLNDTAYGLMTERFCISDSNGDIPGLVRNNRVDGIFLVGGLFTAQIIKNIKKKNMPMVAIGRYYNEIDSVSTDVTKGSYLGLQYLIETGHKNICYINCPQIYYSSAERTAGVKLAIDEYGIKMDTNWMIYCKKNTGEGGYEAIKHLWELGSRPDAIAAANEPIAMGIMRFLYEKKIRIPEDISIIGYEDSVLGGYSAPALTSVNIGKERMGELAAGIMLKRLANNKEPIKHEVLQPRLVIRDSVRIQ